MNVKKALGVSLLWVVLAAIFNAGIYFVQGPHKALEFTAGYLIELSLSVDNLFVFLMIFKFFKVDSEEQSKVLFWGIVGAQLMRAIFIIAGVALLSKFQWLIYVLGLFLVYTGVNLFLKKEKEVHPEDNVLLKGVKNILPGLAKFWVVLIVVETTDLIFAVDSIPAILAITKDPFIVYSSNIFAILGLRAMYFALAGLMPLFHHLHYAIGAILIFVGLKMFLEHYIQVPIAVALGFIAITLLVSIATSLLYPNKK